MGARVRLRHWRERTLAAFCRARNATADKTLSPGGFYQRLTPLFAAYLRDLVER